MSSPPAIAADADDWALDRIVRPLQAMGAHLLETLLGHVLAQQGVGGVVSCRFTPPLQDPPKPKGRPRGPAFMRDDPDWRQKARALIAGRRSGRFWPMLLQEAGVSRDTADKMIEAYEKEQREQRT